MSLHTLHYIQSFQVAVLINYGQLLAIFSNNTALDKYQIKLSHSIPCVAALTGTASKVRLTYQEH